MTPTQEAQSGRQVVAGIDGSSTALAALRWAAQQADMTEATLQAIVVWDWPRSYTGLVLLPDDSDYNPAAEAQRLLDEAVSGIQEEHHTLTVSRAIVQGHPAPVLVEASRGAAMLVIGNRGHGEIIGMLLGSVSEYCVAHAHCPVLVYHQPAHPR